MKHAKKAFLASLLATLLCVTMLIGTTFAWFTDSVTSGGNIIKSGTLNIDLGIKTATDTDYVSVKNNPTKKAFDYDLWEPGYTEWVNAKVFTTGNLALNYTMKIVAEGTVSDLANVIDVYYSPTEVAKPASRDLTGLTKIGTLAEALNGTLVIQDKLIPGTADANGVTAADYATMALHMQETAGNEYQNLSIGSSFSFQILATQRTKEVDSFDDQYDAAALFPEVATVTVPANGAASSLTAGGVTVELPANTGATDNVYKLDVTDVDTTTDATTGVTEVSFDATLYLNNVKVEGSDTLYTMTLNIGGGATNLVVTHNGTALTEGTGDQQYQYDSSTGILTIYTKSFSPFAVSYKQAALTATKGSDVKAFDSLADLRDSVNAGELDGYTINLYKNVDISGEDWLPIGTWEYPFNGTFNGNGKTISGLTKTRTSTEDIYSTGSTTQYMGVVFGLFGIVGGGDVAIQNLTLSNVDIELPTGAQVGALIGYVPGNGDYTSSSKGGAYWTTTGEEGKKALPANYGTDDLTLSNVAVSGSISAKQHVGGLVGKTYTSGAVSVTNCTNNASIECASGSCAGLVGYIHYASSAIVDGCVNNGNITSVSTLAGIIHSSNGFTLTAQNCSNSGTITWTGAYKTIGYACASSSADSWNFIADAIELGNKTLANNTNTGKFVYGSIELSQMPDDLKDKYTFADADGNELTISIRNHNYTLKIDGIGTFEGRWLVGINANNDGDFLMRPMDTWTLCGGVKDVKTTAAFDLGSYKIDNQSYSLSFNITGDDLALLKTIIALDGDDGNSTYNHSLDW